MRRLRELLKYFTRASKAPYKSHPNVGDKVMVRAGFGGYLEGVVSRVVINDHDAYCWVDEYSSDGSRILRSGTASFSYCVFEYL